MYSLHHISAYLYLFINCNYKIIYKSIFCIKYSQNYGKSIVSIYSYIKGKISTKLSTEVFTEKSIQKIIYTSCKKIHY